jgi:hypothetical protein
VIAEKFEAMRSPGIANSRMKDFRDIQILSREFSFDGIVLSEAIKKTFVTRGTQLPLQTPLVFTAEFFDDADKKRQGTRDFKSDPALPQIKDFPSDISTSCI